MRFSPQILDEIRTRLPVSEVVGRKVRLKKAGREWKGLSPFNAEKSPSFFVNDQKGFYHCFSSGKHGDIFTFLIETEGLSFPESVERLASEAGVPLPKTTREDQAAEQRRRSLHEVVELAASFFEDQLKGRAGAKARDYLARRGILPETQGEFRIGYAPSDRFALRDHLAGKDVTTEAMLEVGLLVGGEDVSVPFDRFRDRVMFPIGDARGRVVGFGGRALSADVPAKYLNSPDTPLFGKGRLLYNLHRARGPAHDRGTVIAVEGYVDAIALSATGFPHVVAPLGTALTEDQLGLLWRMAAEPVLCFDGDKAGLRAAYRALDLALPHLEPGRSLRFALLPEGQDPDDLVRSGGPAAMEAVLKGARPLADMLWAREAEAGPLDTPDQRAALECRLREAVALIRDESLRRHYRDDVRNRMSSLPGAFGGRREGWPRRAAPAFASRRPPTSARVGLHLSPVLARSALWTGHGAESPREALILSVLLADPDRLESHAEALSELDLAGPDARALRAFLLDCAAAGEPLDPAVLRSRLERAGLSEAVERLKRRVTPGDRWALEVSADPERLDDTLRQAMALHRKARALHSELRAAERALAAEGGETEWSWLREVQGQLSSLEGAEADRDDGTGRDARDG